MNGIFYLLPILIIASFSIQNIYADEVGYNYDIVNNNDGTSTFTSHSPRILVDGNYENYKFTNIGDVLRFESEAVSFEFNKVSCDFSLFENGLINGQPRISNYSSEIFVNGILIPIPVCLANNNTINEYEDGVDFVVIRGAVTVYFTLDYVRGVEWTYDIVGNGVITVKETCEGCTGSEEINIISPEKKQFKINGFKYDTKTETHGAFKETRTENNNFIVEYEIVSIGNVIIDPTFIDNPSHDRFILEYDNNDVCDDTGSPLYWYESAGGGTLIHVVTYDVPFTSDCLRSYEEFDITAIPDTATLVSGDLVVFSTFDDTNEIDVYSMETFQPSLSSSAPTLFDGIDDDTFLQTWTPTSGADKLKWFNFTGGTLTHLEGRLSDDWFAFGLRLQNETLNFANTKGQTWHSDTGTTPPVLTIEYTDGIFNISVSELQHIIDNTTVTVSVIHNISVSELQHIIDSSTVSTTDNTFNISVSELQHIIDNTTVINAGAFVPSGKYIHFYILPATNSTLGGIYSFNCGTGNYVQGIYNNGSLICTALP